MTPVIGCGPPCAALLSRRSGGDEPNVLLIRYLSAFHLLVLAVPELHLPDDGITVSYS
jgi:hypothetical protein